MLALCKNIFKEFLLQFRNKCTAKHANAVNWVFPYKLYQVKSYQFRYDIGYDFLRDWTFFLLISSGLKIKTKIKVNFNEYKLIKRYTGCFKIGILSLSLVYDK